MNKIWRQLEQRYGNELPRFHAVYVKANIDAISFAYPHRGNQIGHCFEFTTQTGYHMEPEFTMDFGAAEYPGINGTVTWSETVENRYCSYPDLNCCTAEYANLGLGGESRFGVKFPGAYTWELSFSCLNEGMRLERRLYSLIYAREGISISQRKDGIILHLKGRAFYLACSQPVSCFLYESDTEMRSKLGISPETRDQGVYLAIEHCVSLAPGERWNVVYGLSEETMELAQQALDAEGLEQSIAGRWDTWFESLPYMPFSCEEEKILYYKCWWTIRNNYYMHPEWGHSVTESLPVYKGIWQWAMSSVEWHSDQNTEYTSEWIRKSMDMMLAAQREDGYITHAIYVDDRIPGERWMKSDTVQMPHLPWAALRYYYATRDGESLARWYPKLERYYRYLSHSRDEKMENRHLWAITSSFDTGLDTFPAFQRVTYGEDGISERYVYAASMGAERFRYEQAMGRMAEILGYDGAAWNKEAKRTQRSLHDTLWDAEKGWFGVRHEDGTLDTRIGLDGLFALVYQAAEGNAVHAMRKNIEKLIGPYGIRTMAEGEAGYREDIYWRGASWAKSCSVMMAVCKRFYPEYLSAVYRAVLRGFLKHPGIWECCVARTGALARSDHGFLCTPGMSSNVGAGDVIGALWIYHGMPMYDIEDVLPYIPMEHVHFGGMRISVEGETMTAQAQELESTQITVRNEDGTLHRVTLTSGEKTRL